MRDLRYLAVGSLVAWIACAGATPASAQSGRVGGVVKDDSGEPIKGATVSAENMNIAQSFTATTDDKGRFVILGLRSGPWQFIAQAPGFDQVAGMAKRRLTAPTEPDRYYEHLLAREQLMFNVLKVMADHRLDALVYKSIEHQPRLITEVLANAPQRGVPTMSTFLGWVPTLTVPAGFTSDNLPVGITFMGRPYDDGTMVKLAYAYEQATHHRQPPGSTPPLPR